MPIKHSDRRPLLRFQKAAVTYQFICLPFGLSSVPRIFTKITRPITAWLCQLGCRMISYIDDNLLIASSKQKALLMGHLAVTLRTTWVHNKLLKIYPRTDSINSISGVFSEYSRDDHHSPSNQNVKNDRGGKQTANCEPNHKKRACQPHRDGIINDDNHSPSTTFLQSFASSKELCATDSNGTRYPHCSTSSSKGRAPMVVRTGSSMEWLLSTSPRKTTQNTDRCIKDRMGRPLLREKNGTPLVPGGGQESHQLSRATSNISSHPNFYQPPIQHNNSDTDRQHICTSTGMVADNPPT